ncbi:glycine-rich domain-containing protein [Sessilibacter sp. MAH4]
MDFLLRFLSNFNNVIYIGIFTVLVLVLTVVIKKGLSRRTYQKRLAYITTYKFPKRIYDKLQQNYPHLTQQQTLLAEQGLRDYFELVIAAQQKSLAMPSQAVDHLWHEFILFTRNYEQFCKKAFGRFLHHTPTEAMTSPKAATAGIKRTWRLACLREKINPKSPSRLPFLFALDSRLKIPDGFYHQLKCSTIAGRDSNSNAGNNGYCAEEINCSSDCGSSFDNNDTFGCSSDSSSSHSGSSCSSCSSCSSGGD